MKKVLFKETQKFRQTWILVLLMIFACITIGVFGYGFFKQIILDQTWGTNSMSNNTLIFSATFNTLLIASLIVLFIKAKLVTTITTDGIYYKFFPFHFKERHILWSDVEKFNIRTYDPITEYGGWGVKYSITGKGKAFNVSGNIGLQLYLKDGNNIMFGTQNSEEISKILPEISL